MRLPCAGLRTLRLGRTNLLKGSIATLHHSMATYNAAKGCGTCTWLVRNLFVKKAHTMKNLLNLMLVAALAVMITGCSEPETAPEKKEDAAAASTTSGTTNVSLKGDVCGKCGDTAGAETCCKGEKCACGMQKDSALCCSGVKSADVVYCAKCGFGKGTENCCAESNETCTKCSLAKGSDLCCKVKAEGDHDDADHGDDHN